MALSSTTRTILKMRTPVEFVDRKTFSVRWNSGEARHEVLEHLKGKATVVFHSKDRAIAQRAMDRFEYNN